MRNIIGKFWSAIMGSINKVKAGAIEKATSSNAAEALAKKRTLRYAVFLSYQGKNYFGMQVCSYSFVFLD
jgi:hypothetical protein